MTIGLLLSILFLILQLTGNIDWQWWQIAMPIFIELAFTLFIFLIAGAGAFRILKND